MQEKTKKRIMDFKNKSAWKNKLLFIFLFSLSFLAIIGTLIAGIVTKQWSYLFTVLMTSAIFIFAKWISTLAYKNLLGKPVEGIRLKKAPVVFKSIFIYMGINLLYILPFIIVWLTVLLTTTTRPLTVQVYTDSPYFSMWMVLGWLIFLIIFSSAFTLIVNFDKKINPLFSKGWNLKKTSERI